MKRTLVNAGMEYHKPQIIPGTSLTKSTSPPTPAPMRPPIHLELTPCDSTSTTTSMKNTCLLNISYNHQLQLDHPSTLPELKDHSIVGSAEPESILDSEDLLQLDSISLCFGEPILRKLNQVKLLCNPTSSTLCDLTLEKLNQETEFYITNHTPLVHAGTPFSVPKSSSGTNRVSDCHSSLVTTSSSRWILDKHKIEVTKALIHHIGKNGEHFYGENFIYEYPKSWNNINLNYISYGCMLMEIDWGDKWHGHETHPIGHNTSKIDWGGHEPNPNHMNESLLSEVDWGAHESSVFLFLVNIEYDAKPNESSIQGLWGELHHRTSSIRLIGLQSDSLATGQTGDDIFNFTPFNPDLDDPELRTGESIHSFLTLVVQLQWLVASGRLVTHVQVTILSKLKSTQRKLQRAYGYVLKITQF